MIFSFGLPLKLRRRAGLAVPEMLDDALHHIVIAGDMAADEGRRMREWNIESAGTEPFSFEVLMKALRSSPMTSAMQVVETAIIFGLYIAVGVGKAVDHVVEAAEHRRVLRHRGGDAGGRLLEMT